MSITNAEQILVELNRLHELIRHLHNVQNACLRMGEKLIQQGRFEFGRCLIANSYIHDQSKFRGIEWSCIGSRDAEDKNGIPLAIRNHQQSNPHHPEYWGGIENMPEIYIAEMVADWWARSTEMGTNFRQWIDEQAPVKFGFEKNSKVDALIHQFAALILDEPFS